jgi:ABC-type antimicrobial peptide transport system permease subunit
MILKEELIFGAVGLGVGLIVAVGFARFLKTELYGVTTYDPATLFVSGAVLLAMAAVACYIPARRAMSVDPMTSLRCE